MNSLSTVTAPIAYIADEELSPIIKVFPASSGKPIERPDNNYVEMPIADIRGWSTPATLKKNGFEHHQSKTSFSDYFNMDSVKENYYPDVTETMKKLTGAREVFVFDHNVRSAVKSAQGIPGIRTPVAAVHADYTHDSGPKRTLEILQDFGRTDLAGSHSCLINLWRPIIGPVVDVPLTLCDVETLEKQDLISTDILHYQDGDIVTPGHTGVIYSVKHNPAHRWVYVSEMTPEDVLLIMCFDSEDEDCRGYAPHTGFINPDCPEEFTPRESIEARTLVIF
jgi:hypothetical protein